MSEYLPKDVREGLELARKTNLKRKSRLRVQVGDRVLPILKTWENGFALDRENTDHFRGVVDVFDGSRHLYRALVVASREDGDLMAFDFKRATIAADHAPVDYEVPTDAPVALLPR